MTYLIIWHDSFGKREVLREFKNRKDADDFVSKHPLLFCHVEERECQHEEIKLTGKAETENLHCSCGFSIPF